jgi:hypothetical protein
VFTAPERNADIFRLILASPKPDAPVAKRYTPGKVKAGCFSLISLREFGFLPRVQLRQCWHIS